MLDELKDLLIERYKEYYRSYLELLNIHTEGKGITAGHLQEISYILHIAYRMSDVDIMRIEQTVRESRI